jgi:sugar diacid utilization regulator
MAIVTVGDLLRLVPAERLRPMAGHAGLGREVRWATSLRATPPYLSHLTGAEIVVLTAGTLRAVSPPLSLPPLIRALAERGAAAAVTDRLSTEAVDAAEAARLPLLLAAQSAGSELENELNRLINERLNYLYSVSSTTGRRFAELAVNGGLAAILEHAATLIDKTVLWEDEGFATLMAVPPPNQPLAYPAPQPPAAFRPDWRGGQGPDGLAPVETAPGSDGYRRLVAPVIVSGLLRGYLSAVTREAEFTDVDRTVVQRAAEACAFELLRSPSHRREESPAIEALLVELLTGRYGSESALLGRARYLGVAVEQPHAVIAVDPAAPQRRDARAREETARLLSLELRGRLGEALLVRGLEPAAVVLAPLTEPVPAERERLRRVLTDIVRRLNARLGGEASLAVGIGAGQPGLAGYARAYQEARYALRVGAVIGLEPPVDFATLGFYRLLFPLHRDEELAAFRDEVLGTLLHYDGRRNSEMIATLEAYFDSGCNVIDAAERLHVHRNSLAYRLRRVAEITGRDLHHQEHLFLLQLALKIHRVLEAVAIEQA